MFNPKTKKRFVDAYKQLIRKRIINNDRDLIYRREETQLGFLRVRIIADSVYGNLMTSTTLFIYIFLPTQIRKKEKRSARQKIYLF